MIECRGFVRSFLSLRAGQTENAENRHPGREYPRGGDYFYFSSGWGAINRATRNYYFSEQQNNFTRWTIQGAERALSIREICSCFLDAELSQNTAALCGNGCDCFIKIFPGGSTDRDIGL